MDPRVESLLDELAQRGVAKLHGALAPSILDRLQRAAADLRLRRSESWDGAAKWFAEARWRPAHFAGDGRNANFYDCLGVDPRLDSAVEELLATPAIRELLDRAVGTDRRLWFAQLRWAEPGGEEYVLHQDVYGEIGLCIYLSDHPDDAGSMVLWPGSHRWPRVLEALPPLHPCWVKERLVSVEGVAGDVCVFLNKTWHGRTSARGDTRLVMLLSFIPPGPVEKARRPTESERAAFGPEVRRVTDPSAGASFDDAWPTTPPFTATFETPRAASSDCTFARHAERATVDYAWAWCVAHAGVEPTLSREDAALLRMRRMIAELVPCSIVPGSTLDALLERFRRRSDRRGASPRAGHLLRRSRAAWNGDGETASWELELAQRAPSDWLSGCPACELDAFVRAEADLGNPEAALAMARPLLEGALSCDSVPGVTWSALLLPFLRAGRRDEAQRAHERGWPAVVGRPERFAAIGRHLEYLALAPDPSPALAVYLDHVAMARDHRCDGDLWHFWSGAWLLFSRMDRAGHRFLDTIDATEGATRRASVAALAASLQARLARLAARIDSRNGNEHRRRLLRELQSR